MQSYCRACRAALPEGAQFCPACGAHLGQVAETEVRSRADSESCPSCGQPLRVGAGFCRHCGAPSAAKGVAAAVAADPPPQSVDESLAVRSPKLPPSAPAHAAPARRARGTLPLRQGQPDPALPPARRQRRGRALLPLALATLGAFIVWQWLPSDDAGGGWSMPPPGENGAERRVPVSAAGAPLDVEGIEGIVDIDPVASTDADGGSGLQPAPSSAGSDAGVRDAARLAASGPARDDPAMVLTRVLAAQARGDLAALEQEWDLNAFGTDSARLQSARLQAVAATVRIDEFEMRERATLFSEDGSHAMVRVEVGFRATHASGVSRWANGVLGVLRRSSSDAGWTVIGVVPDELLNNELAERADLQAHWRAPVRAPLRPLRVQDASARTCALAAAAAGPAVGLSSAGLAMAAQDQRGQYARPITYAELNRELDAAMNREFGLTKLKFVANGLNTQIGQVPGAGDLVSFVYQIGDTAANSMEVLGETMKHGFTHIGALKAAQVFAGVVQLASELVPPADVASDLFQYRLESITANAEIRRTIHHLKQDLESGRLKFSVPRLRVAAGRTYPPGVRISIEDPGSALLDPSNPDMVRISHEGAVVGIAITTPDLLRIASPRLPFEVVAQVVINPGQLRYEAFDERAAKVLGAVQRGGRWVIPVLIGRQATADASTGSPVLADFQRMRLKLEVGEHPDSAATWGWQPCRGTQRVAARLENGSSTLPVAVRNNFLNSLRSLAVVDGQGRVLQRVTLGPGEALDDLRLVGMDPSGSKLNLTAFLRRQLACVEVGTPDPAVVKASTSAQGLSLSAAAPGRSGLTVRIRGDAETPDLALELPIVVTQGEAGWHLAEVQRKDFEVPLLLNHRRETRFSDTGLNVTCGVTQTIPDPDLPMAQWPRVGYDADVRVHWGALPDKLVVGQTVSVSASVSRQFEPTSGWLGDAPAASVLIDVPDAATARADAGATASASFVVPPPRAGRTLGISLSAGGCGADTRRVFVYRPVAE